MNQVPPPAPFGAVPNGRQLAWQSIGMYAFIHFTVNTFTDRNWGDGTEPENVFNPTELDCDQWCREIAGAGFKGAILTAKHHDGFCLWPSRFTTHSVAGSSWRGGRGDVVREFVDAARRHGLKIGFYLSPWDRHERTYGAGEEYNCYFRNQLRELLTNYGGDDVFIAWFDGACGEGPNGKVQHYDCEAAAAVVHECAPNAVIFGAMDDWRDIRWCGNESGFAGSPNWATIDVYRPQSIHNGDPAGAHYWPSEVDVSIRPEWFYHASEDSKIHSLAHLVDIYFNSVGRGSCLNLNIPPDRRGLFHDCDVKRLREFGTVVKKLHEVDFAAGKRAESTVSRGCGYEAACLTDGNLATYWAAPDGVTTGAAVIELDRHCRLNVIETAEFSALGQRVTAFEVDGRAADGSWTTLVSDNTISFRKMLRFPTVTTDALRLRITGALAPFTISKFGAYYLPPIPAAPVITRSATGEIAVSAPGAAEIRFTTDGEVPGAESELYRAPFVVGTAGIVRAAAVYSECAIPELANTAESALLFGVPRCDWSIAECDSEDPAHSAVNLLGDDPERYYMSANDGNLPHYVVINTGSEGTFRGFILTHPAPELRFFSLVSRYRVSFAPAAAGPFTVAAQGEFANIANNPIPQKVNFREPVEGRFVKVEVLDTAPESREGRRASFARFELF